jgi:alpha-tubulin suppressor-like RCC1 family protein
MRWARWWVLVLFAAHCGGRSELTLVLPQPDAASAHDGRNEDAPRPGDGGSERDASVDAHIDASESGVIDAPECAPPMNVTVSLPGPDDVLVVKWDPVPPVVDSLSVIRDGMVAAVLKPSETALYDTPSELDGGAGFVAATPPASLVATLGTRTDGVLLTWAPAQLGPDPKHTYAVVARCANGGSASSNEVTGSFGVPSIQYGLSRDDGITWSSIAPGQSFLDTSAPYGLLAMDAPPSAIPNFQLGAVALTTSVANVALPGSVTYRVRALTRFGTIGETDPAIGYRGMGPITYQWQRSSGSTDGDYSDLTGVTGASWFDSTAPPGQQRFYRVVALADGATSGVSRAVSAVFPVRAIAIDAGPKSTCVIDTDSKLRCWGSNDFGATPAGPSAESFKSLSVGGNTTCAIRTDDTVECFGGSAPPSAGTFKAISAGGTHVCGIGSDDHVICWGDNKAGEAPTTPSVDTFLAVAAGDQYTCGIRTDATLACWGFPLMRPAPSGTFKTISAGSLHVCATRSDDKVLCWGTDQAGEAPVGPSVDSYKVLAAGQLHTCGIRSDDKVVCWGSSGWGAAPQTPSIDSYKAIAAGDNHTCGIRTDGTIVCWGRNDAQQAPQAPSSDSFVAVAAGNHVCGIRTDGKVVCWGGDASGGAPSGPSADSFRAITVGAAHTCAIRSADNKVICWGNNQYGQAPSGPSTSAFQVIAAGTYHTCGVRSDAKVVCWGINQYAQAPTAPSADDFRDVSAGIGHTCGLRTDAKVVCWGDSTWGQAPSTPSAVSYRSITASDNATCAIRTDDKVDCWGRYYTNTIPTPPSDSFRVLAMGAGHTCGIRFDDHVFCWGDNAHGQLAAAPSLGQYLAIGAGVFTTCGVRNDHKVLCWGNDDSGQARTLIVVP